MAIILPPRSAQASRIRRRAPQQKLDLSVETAQLVTGPALQRIVQLRIDPEQKGAALRHELVALYW